jgi:hypothetical protein
MGEFFNKHVRLMHKIPETKVGLGHHSEMEDLRKAFNEANAPEEPVVIVEDPMQEKRDRMAHARDVAKANREAKRVESLRG